MIQFPANANVLVMHEPISFRSGIDGTAAVARIVLKKEPMDGAFFIFRNKLRHMLRILYYDGSGFFATRSRTGDMSGASGSRASVQARSQSLRAHTWM